MNLNPKEQTLLFDIADKLDVIERRLTIIEARQKEIEAYFFKDKKKQD